MVPRSVLIGWDDGGRRGGIGIVIDEHWESLGDPLGRGDPHDQRGTLDLDDPKFKLS